MIIHAIICNTMSQNSAKPQNSNKTPDGIIIKLDKKNTLEIAKIATQLKTNPAQVINKAIYLLKLVQGRTIILKQKNKSETLKINDFEKTKPIL